ncbi:hypothetical protein [Spongiactinospora sp. TRM90649]|uniref:hypothetical protein n=1 Tax=Spongiactinospora sp. TRM90649 TaxID=3031114 RepID=UPI0023F7A57E|nr:hypothetical protein [Spongiactinospora sp. TRM90649]MDF5755834.1 hypothetical protein [Spongiactinospora sp. TRM90649]
MKISKYWKSLLAVVGAVVVAGEAVVGDLVITPDEWVSLGIALLTALGVWAVPNAPAGDGEPYGGGAHRGRDLSGL